MTNLKDSADLAKGFFERKQRESGEQYYSIREGSPEWVREFVREAGHNNGAILPDDYRYEYVLDALHALHALSYCEDSEDAVGEISADVYTSDLLAWVSTGNRCDYVDAAIEDGYTSEGFTGVLQAAQAAEREEIMLSVISWLESHEVEEMAVAE